jgi:glycosyltransferase involved in cell wall biosynthesis
VRAVGDLSRSADVRVDLVGSGEILRAFSAAGVALASTLEIPAQTTRLSALGLLDPRRLRVIRRALDGTPADVLFLNLPSSEYGATPLVDGLSRRVPAVGLLHVHQPLSTLPFHLARTRERVAGVVLRRVTRLCVLSSWAADQVTEGWRVPRAAIDVMPMVRPEVKLVEAAAARVRLGLPGGLLVGIAGRVSFAQKGHDVVLDAAEALRRTTLGIRIVVAGDGPDLGLLRSEIVRRGLEKELVLLGRVSSIGLFLSAVDAIVIPSRFEGLPLIALEALWAGTPGIASRIDGLKQVWPERWLVEPGDPQALAMGLAALLAASPVERLATVAVARERIAGSTAADLSPFFRGVLESAAAGLEVV